MTIEENKEEEKKESSGVNNKNKGSTINKIDIE